MNNRTIHIAVALAAVLNLFTGPSAYTQITAPGADAVKLLTYPVHPVSDPLFVFYQSYGGHRLGSLTAGGPGAGFFDFVWTMYDPAADAFSIPVKAETGVETSSITGLDEGGYRVQVSNGMDVDTAFVAWVMLDNLTVNISKDGEGKLLNGASGCPVTGDYLQVVADVQTDKFSYYDLQTHQEVALDNDYEAAWVTDNSELDVRSRTYQLELYEEDGAVMPVADTWFAITVTDSLGMSETDSVFYDTKFTRAAFSLEYFDKVTNSWVTDLNTEWSKDKGSLDAPLEVKFINESENGLEFTWVLLDTMNSFADAEKLVSGDAEEQPVFTYYTADRYYYPYLVSVSDAGCPDTFLLEEGIRVVPSQLQIPNVFTPNDDGTNDVFIFKHQSIKECRITISDRAGRVVYRQKIDDIYAWEGWRGTVLNSDRKAPEGQYYYVVEGLGYDNQEYKDPNILEQRRNDNQAPGNGTGGDEETPSQNIYTGWLYLFRHKGIY